MHVPTGMDMSFPLCWIVPCMTVNEQMTHHVYSQLNVTYQAGLLKHSVNRLLAYMLWVGPGPLSIRKRLLCPSSCVNWLLLFNFLYILEHCIEPRELTIPESLCRPNFIHNIWHADMPAFEDFLRSRGQQQQARQRLTRRKNRCEPEIVKVSDSSFSFYALILLSQQRCLYWWVNILCTFIDHDGNLLFGSRGF